MLIDCTGFLQSSTFPSNVFLRFVKRLIRVTGNETDSVWVRDPSVLFTGYLGESWDYSGRQNRIKGGRSLIDACLDLLRHELAWLRSFNVRVSFSDYLCNVATGCALRFRLLGNSDSYDFFRFINSLTDEFLAEWKSTLTKVSETFYRYTRFPHLSFHIVRFVSQFSESCPTCTIRY